MARLLSDFQQGTLSNGGSGTAGSYTTTDDTFTAPNFSSLPTVGGSDYLVLLIDPFNIYGHREQLTVTSHASGSQTVTVERATNGTSPGLGPFPHNTNGIAEPWGLCYGEGDFAYLQSQVSALQTSISGIQGGITFSFDLGRSYDVTGPLIVPSGGNGYLPAVDVPVGGAAVALLGAWAAVRSGSLVLDLQYNGTDIGGLNSLAVGTSKDYNAATSPVDLSNGDQLQPVITSVANDPDGLSLTLNLQYTITLNF